MTAIAWTAPDRPLAADCRVLCSRRAGGVSAPPWQSLNLATHVGDRPAAVAENRRRLRAAVGCPPIQWLDQVHGIDCVEVPAGGLGRVPEADACWTRSPTATLALLTADCLPVVLCGQTPDGGRVLAVAHAGWRGLTGGILHALLTQLPAAAEELAAWIGPAIGGDAYQVGAEVVAAVADMPDGGRLLEAAARPDGGGRYRLDLAVVARLCLEGLGVRRVSGGDHCTFTDGGFYSYRRDGVTGRQATLAWLS